MLELRHLRTLIALAEAGNISVAARRVHLTQSALSHQLKVLEEHYGTRLFERKSNPLRLSPAGHRLLRLAHEVTARVAAADSDIARIIGGESGTLRIAVECHTCFDWLMPSMDAFRENWPEVEMDLVSGFHPDPVGLLEEGRADFVITSEPAKRKHIVHHPLFRFEIFALLAGNHPLVGKEWLEPADFAKHTLITYPVPEHMIDVIRQRLEPAGIHPERRTVELTIAILQLVASRRGIAALPGWAVHAYIERGYVIAKRVGKGGLWSKLYAATTNATAQLPYLRDFLATVRRVSFATLPEIEPLRK
ncbi:MAG: LysR family transcriptional regulator [Betaproteobacteria bacterium]|nr:LysR family transcriptional regulator [Betaproteobacteria bacterium]